MRKLTKTCLIALGAFTVAACTQQGAYSGLQSGQREQCHKLPEAGERERCLQAAAQSYDDYRREREAVLSDR